MPSALTVQTPSAALMLWSTVAVAGLRSRVVGSRVAPGLAVLLLAGFRFTGMLNAVLALTLVAVGAAVGLTAMLILAIASWPLLSATV